MDMSQDLLCRTTGKFPSLFVFLQRSHQVIHLGEQIESQQKSQLNNPQKTGQDRREGKLGLNTQEMEWGQLHTSEIH